MSLLMAEGFDFFGPGWDEIGDARWQGNAGTIATNYGRRGAPGIASMGGYGVASYYFRYALDTEETSVVVGFALYPGLLTSVTSGFFQVVSAASANQFVVDVTTAGRLRVKASATGAVLAESVDGVIEASIWHYIEIKFTCTGTDTVQVRVNEADVIPSTGGLNLRQSGAGGVGMLRFASAGNAGWYDDMYLLTTGSGSPYDDFLGDKKIEGHLFTADGALTGWTSNKASHYDAIDDRGTTFSPYYTYYNESDAVGEKDSYSITPAAMTTVNAVTLCAYARNPGGGIAKMKPFVRSSGGTLYYGDEQTLVSDPCNLLEYTWYSNPASSLSWTKADLSSMQFGWESTELA